MTRPKPEHCGWNPVYTLSQKNFHKLLRSISVRALCWYAYKYSNYTNIRYLIGTANCS